MASCLLRNIVKPQIFRYVAQSTASRNVVNKQHRNIHVSPSICQKYYSEGHEWIDVADSSKECTIGITNYAKDQLGDVVYVQLPEIGQEISVNGELGVLESVKAASDIYSPVSGEVTEVNEAVADNNNIIQSSFGDDGWLFKMILSTPSELEKLMTETAYNEFVKSIE